MSRNMLLMKNKYVFVIYFSKALVLTSRRTRTATVFEEEAVMSLAASTAAAIVLESRVVKQRCCKTSLLPRSRTTTFDHLQNFLVADKKAFCRAAVQPTFKLGRIIVGATPLYSALFVGGLSHTNWFMGQNHLSHPDIIHRRTSPINYCLMKTLSFLGGALRNFKSS